MKRKRQMRRTTMTGRFRNWLDDRLNNLKIKKKLFLLYFYCMILPLVLTDAVIIGLIVKREYDTRQETSRGIVSAVKYSLNSAAEETVMLSKNIYFNKYINEFLNTEFQSTLDYYNQYQELLKDSLFGIRGRGKMVPGFYGFRTEHADVFLL